MKYFQNVIVGLLAHVFNKAFPGQTSALCCQCAFKTVLNSRISGRTVCLHITHLCGSTSDMKLLQKIHATAEYKEKDPLMIFLFVQCICCVYCLCSTRVC